MRKVLFTTTAFRHDQKWKVARIGFARCLVADAVRRGFTVVVLDDRSLEADLMPLKDTGAHVFQQEARCKDDSVCTGVSRREALSRALEFATDPSDFLIWTEPEKHPLIWDLHLALDTVEGQETQMVMFNRTSLESYPPEQAHAYAIVRLAARYLVGYDLDFMFGPVAFRREISHYWSDYDGAHGDKWDCIHIPKLRALRAGVAYRVFSTSYVHPPEQTASEIGNVELLMKRIEQASVVVRAMAKEYEPRG